jgi:phosphate transport system substrate-binding protein
VRDRFYATLAALLCMLTLATPRTAHAQNNALPPVDPFASFGDLLIAGSSGANTLTSRLLLRFREQGFAGGANLETLDLAQAINRFCNGELDILSADRPLSQGELDRCAQNGRTVVELPVARSAIMVVVSTQNTFYQNASIEDLRAIFASATSWQSIDPTYPNAPIDRFFPDVVTSEFILFTNLVFDGDARPLLTAIGAQFRDTQEQLRDAIIANPTAATFVNAAFANQNSTQLRRTAVNGISPDASSISSGSYPLTTTIRLYTTRELMQQQNQVADFTNFTIQNANANVEAVGLYALPAGQLSQTRDAWYSATGAQPGSVAQAPQQAVPTQAPPPVPTQAPPPVPTQAPAPEVPREDSAPETQPEAPAAPTETGQDFNAETELLLTQVRADMDALAEQQLGAQRPEGWSGSLDTTDPNLVLLVRLDLELLTGTLLGQETRPANWFGAVQSTPSAIARDIRHDLELLADEVYGLGERPDAWVGGDPLLRCNRATQALVNLLQRGGFYTLDVDLNAPDFCQQAEIAASRFSELNLLAVPEGGRIFSPSAIGRTPGAYTIETEFAVAFLDRTAAQSVGVIPAGSPIRPVARSYAQFSNMTLVEGDEFLLFIDYRNSNLTTEEFEDLPDIAEQEFAPFCSARWC